MGTQRKIIHCDCDCFYAAIEERDRPELKNQPLAVGGSADRRGVLTTCNYEARAFGVHSAMPTAHAYRLCPDLIVLPVQMQKYRDASAIIKQIFERFTDKIQPLSLDEAFLDVSDTRLHHGSATLIAREIKRLVLEEVGITISAGVAPNKFLAKIASDWDKPDGLTVITPDDVGAFVAELPVKKIFGVGKVTAKKMSRMNIETCADLQAYDQVWLIDNFGTFGARLYDLCRGIDDREVSTSGTRKSYSSERTYNHDLVDAEECADALQDIYEELESGIAPHLEKYNIKKVFVKLKFNDFTQTTAEKSTASLSLEVAQGLLEVALSRKELPVRLIGLGVGFMPPEQNQLAMFEEQDNHVTPTIN